MLLKKYFYEYLLAAGFFWLFMGALYAVYSSAFPASFQFDDFSNLSWLSAFDDGVSIYSHVFAGKAGPLGRPLALAAFLIDGYAWPFDSALFHRTNTLLHLLNFCLLVGLLERLRCSTSKPSGARLTILSACLWATLPLLATSILMTVQRMVLLSATFILAGIWMYLSGRARLSENPRFGIVLIIISIYLFTPLAVLSKENGVLLPLYIVVIEFTLLPPLRVNFDKREKIAIRMLLIAPVVVLFAYLGQMLLHFNALTAAYNGRSFGVSERLQTEVVVLWKYLRLAFLPNMAELGPFQDGQAVYSIVGQPFVVLSSGLAWSIVAVIAVYVRKLTPLPLFALCWFLSGHLLESTIIPLELYFEHRNYLPLIGPVYALTIGIGNIIKSASVRYSVLSAYLAMQLFVLAQTTQLWGGSLSSARYWAEKQPDSIRAAQFLAQQLMQHRLLAEASHWLERAAVRHPVDAALLLQIVQLQCEARTLSTTLLAKIKGRLPHAEYSPAAVPTLNALSNLAIVRRCDALDIQSLHAVLDVLMQNSAFAERVQYHLHHLKARLYEQEERIMPTIRELEAALAIDPTLDTFLRISSILIEAGYYDAALRPLNDARNYLPRNPFVRRYWLKQLDNYKQEVNAYSVVTQ